MKRNIAGYFGQWKHNAWNKNCIDGCPKGQQDCTIYLALNEPKGLDFHSNLEPGRKVTSFITRFEGMCLNSTSLPPLANRTSSSAHLSPVILVQQT
jgi:hypothetical protein